MAIAIEKIKLRSAAILITKGMRPPLVIPKTNNTVTENSFPEPKILPAEEIKRGGIAENPRPMIAAPR